MSQKISLLTLNVKASATIAAYTFITVAGATAAEGADAHGVAVFDAIKGDLVATDVLGTTIVNVDTAVSAGDRVAVGSAGGIKPSATGAYIVGRALTDASAGDLTEILLFQGAAAAVA